MHIVLYVLDALRADHLGCYGYQRDISTNIDRLAASGVVFEKCFSSSTWTRPVAASILSGAYPAVHGTRTRAERFSAPIARFPELLQRSAFKTIGINAMGNIAAELGFSTGFDTYIDLFRDPEMVSRREKQGSVRQELVDMLDGETNEMVLPLGEDLVERFAVCLEDLHDQDAFFFMWSLDPHAPYSPPQGFRRFSRATSNPQEGLPADLLSAGKQDAQRLMDLYDDEISYADHCIGELVRVTREAGTYDDTLFIIIGDHGESFYEHGVYAHGHAPFEEVIHVPMIMKFPENRYAETRVRQLAALVDIFQTVLAAAGCQFDQEETAFVQGRNLLPLLDGQPDPGRDYVFSDTQTLDFHNRYLSVRGNRWKYIRLERPGRGRVNFTSLFRYVFSQRMLSQLLRSPLHYTRNFMRRSNEYLFDLDADPQEQHNLVSARPEVAANMQAALADWLGECRLRAEQAGAQAGPFQESDDLKEHLEKLGYL